MIKKFRLFLSPIEGQEKWLNERAKEGLKLSKVRRCIYEFEKCEPNQYQYAVEYIGNKSDIERNAYESFLDELGIRYYEKPLNLGQFSAGKFQYRPYANPGGKWATSRGMINREILILEKENDGKPFDIYSNVKDKITALRERRKPHLYLSSFVLLMELYINLIGRSLLDISYLSNRNSSFLSNATLSILLGAIGIISIARMVQLSLSIKTLKEKRDIHE